MKINDKELLDKYFAEAYEQTKKLLSIPSYAQQPKEGKPFGEGVSEALDYAIDLATELGFEATKDAQGRYGFLDYGEGEETFAILCHLDVVPPGNLEKWVTPPFEPIEEDGKLIGRGAFDDKGPTMMNLYALKYLKDNNFKPDYKIRLIFGLTEETTWDSIRAYLEDHGPATIGYTPDAEFPVVYAEKWIVDMDFVSSLPTDFTIKGGSAYNVVNDIVEYTGPKIKEISEFLNKSDIENKIKGDTLIVQGKAGHASLPHLGVNAATWLGTAMKNVGIEHGIVDLLDELHENHNATGLVPSLLDETGDLTQNLGIIEVEDGKQRMAFNYRVPAFADVENDFIKPLADHVKKYGIDTNLIVIEDHVYVPKDSALIKKIMKAYQDVTGDMESQPLAIGGGTYAKAMPNVVAFGAEFDMEVSTMHAYNEYVSVEDLKKMLLIYAKAIALLAVKDK